MDHSINNAIASEHEGYSADVKMEVRIGDQVHPIAHLGPNFLILRYPIECPPTDAEITLSIDGQKSRWIVRLVDGLRSSQRRAAIIPCSKG